MSLIGCASADPPDQGVALEEGGELAAWSPDGSLIAAPGFGKINVLRADGSVVRRLDAPGVTHAVWPCVCGVGWSRDGTRILFLTRGSHKHPAEVGSVSVDGGPAQQRPLGVPGGDATWSPDGWPLIFVANSGAYDFGASHRGPMPDLWRLDGIHSKPHKILAQPGSEVLPQFSPDGRKVLYLRGHAGSRSVWVANADGTDPHAVSPSLWLAIATWSPDGMRIAVAGSPHEGSGRRLYLASVTGGPLHRLRGIGDIGNGLDWTPDGRWITYSGFDGKIWRVHPDGSRRQKIGEIPEHDVRRLLWSPDGKHLAYTALAQQESD